MSQQTNIHYNRPQIVGFLVDAPFETMIAGRGTGKNEGRVAPKSANLVKTMPRGTGVFVGATFVQHLTRTLPPIILGWERLGYKNGVHYIIGQRPPEKWKKLWKYPGAFRPPQKTFEYYITFWNGSGIQLVSQDRPGSSNGVSIDWIMGDEAKLLNHDKLTNELMPANRGIIPAFANNPHHHGITWTTDMPVGTSGRWLFQGEKDMDTKRVREILRLQSTKYNTVQQYKAATNKELKRKLLEQVQAIDVLINKKRFGLVHYHTGSTLENIHGLGIDYIRQLMRDLNDFTFRTAILNRKLMKIEDGFYPDLDEDTHGYFSYDYHKIDNTGYDFDALSSLNGAEIDADYDPLKPLHIALDYNRRICPITIKQLHSLPGGLTEIRGINGMHNNELPSQSNEKLDDTLEKFCKYYKHHLKRTVYYWYDHTATAEYAHAGAQYEEVVKYLRKNDWNVIEMYIGKASGHERRYTMYGHLFREDGYYPYVMRYNRERCKYLLLSMYQAQAEQRKDGFGKDKNSEKDPLFPAEEATHYSEAEDMVVFGIVESGLTIPEEGGDKMTFTFLQ